MCATDMPNGNVRSDKRETKLGLVSGAKSIFITGSSNEINSISALLYCGNLLSGQYRKVLTSGKKGSSWSYIFSLAVILCLPCIGEKPLDEGTYGNHIGLPWQYSQVTESLDSNSRSLADIQKSNVDVYRMISGGAGVANKPGCARCYEVWALFYLKGFCRGIQRRLAESNGFTSSFCGFLGGNSLSSVEFQGLSGQLKGLVRFFKGRLHGLPLLCRIECVENADQYQNQSESQADPFQHGMAPKEYLQRVGWLLVTIGILCATGGCCFLGFLPSFPDRKRLLFFGLGGILLIVAAWFSIHRGLDLLYIDQGVSNSVSGQTRSAISACIARRDPQ